MFEYKVLKEVYDDMVSKKKDIEIRLLNEKSSNIKIGDTIRFKNITNEDVYVDTKVIGEKYMKKIIDLVASSGNGKDEKLINYIRKNILKIII